MTETQQAALAGLSEAGNFHAPPSAQGQHVVTSYACSPDYIYQRSIDLSDRTVTIGAYRHPAGGAGEFEPWNSVPKLGRRVGTIYSGPESGAPA